MKITFLLKTAMMLEINPKIKVEFAECVKMLLDCDEESGSTSLDLSLLIRPQSTNHVHLSCIKWTLCGHFHPSFESRNKIGKWRK